MKNYLTKLMNLKAYRYLILRRIVQISLLILFISSNYWGWKILNGNYSTAILFDSITLSDPYAVLQILASGFLVTTDLIIGGIIILVLYGLFAGRMFCSWICPMNIVADFAIWINQKLQLKTNFTAKRLLKTQL